MIWFQIGLKILNKNTRKLWFDIDLDFLHDEAWQLFKAVHCQLVARQLADKYKLKMVLIYKSGQFCVELYFLHKAWKAATNNLCRIWDKSVFPWKKSRLVVVRTRLTVHRLKLCWVEYRQIFIFFCWKFQTENDSQCPITSPIHAIQLQYSAHVVQMDGVCTWICNNTLE